MKATSERRVHSERKAGPGSKLALVQKLIERSGLNGVQALRAVEELEQIIVDEVEDGRDRVSFGRAVIFTVRHRRARNGTNPVTGEKTRVPAASFLRLTNTKRLKQAFKNRKGT